MPTVPVYNTKGSQVGEIALDDKIFAVKVNKALLHEAVVMQLASRRQGTSSAKNRSAVRGGGRKPWKQKGTGQARVGSRRSPLWTGGGIIFGPTPRDYDYNLPKKARRQALKSALSASSPDAATNTSIASTQTTVYAGFGLVAVGIIVLAAFGLIQIFQ